MKYLHIVILSLLLMTAFTSCREDIYIYPSTSTEVDDPRITGVEGFYLINEGNMGSNKATLDYFDETSGIYHKNIYAERNPHVVKELGDVGNDVEIYGSKLYAVINCSHKVEVMNVNDATSITKIDIPNCRYAIGHGGYVYVSSYVSPVQDDPKAPLGAIFKIDTVSMKVVDRVDVGYQPEEMAISNGKIYIANSGGYRAPDYDRTVSVIDLRLFEVIKDIDVAINLHRVKRDEKGMIYVSSRGDNASIPSALYVIDPTIDRVIAEVDVPISDMWIHGDSAYIYSSARNDVMHTTTVSYSILNLNTLRIVDDKIIKDGTDADIRMPHGIAVHPITGEIYITDARNYVTSGRIHCYSPNGELKWSQSTGEIPSQFAFKTQTAPI
ncbi:MAG: YncE family protein [Muribaculaceae bacterium]|nr:YncE family protein [Muribaculaceae bacterium]